MVFLNHKQPPLCAGDGYSSRLHLDHACLHIKNTDPISTLQLWAQSKECYKCSPWHYATLKPMDSYTHIVNATYPTDQIFINPENNSTIKHSYHFGSFGEYSLDVNSSQISDVKVLHVPDNEVLPLVMCTIIFLTMAMIWQLGKGLNRRMSERMSNTAPVRTTRESSVSGESDVGETSPLIRARTTISYSQILREASEVNSTSNDEVSIPSTSSSTVLISTTGPLPETSSVSTRLKSLDTFRGLAIVVMIFVNYGGGDYYFFKHARWNGLTVADLVFPWFLWIMGVSMTFSIRSQLRKNVSRLRIFFRIFKRCCILFGLGIIINSSGHGHNNFPTFRILGVLQRFSFCYFIVAVVEILFIKVDTHNEEDSSASIIKDLKLSWKQWVATLSFTIIHVCLTFLLPVPGCPTGYLGPGGLHMEGSHSNCTGGAAGYIDIVFLGKGHVYSHPTCKIIYDNPGPYDPEGILGVLTSCLMVQFGVAAGRVILSYTTHKARINRWMLWSLFTGLFAGFLCGWSKEMGVIPVNKNLWSLSFVLTTACFAYFLLAVLYIIIDCYKAWSGNPLRYAGMNSILLYVGHELLGDLLPWSWSPVGYYHANYLFMNVWGAGLWAFIAYIFHRKRVYLSV